MLEVVLINRRGRGWEWRVHDQFGNTVMSGREKTRQAAKYKGDRALFQLLLSNPKFVDQRRPT